MSRKTPPSSEALKNATGPIPFNMTNDYMFKVVLQANSYVLIGLVSSLLYIAESEISSIEISNTTTLGENVKDKEYRLDINLTLNHHHLINLEMQVTNKLNWPDRSLCYLCRAFDNLNKGENYSMVRPAIHIGFLDYTLFSDCPEFHAVYKLKNDKNNYLYSDKFTLSVIDLTRIDLATRKDKHYHLHHWASFFKATTWEEIKMLAKKDPHLHEAAEILFRFNADDLIRKRCRDREDYFKDLRNYENKVSDLTIENTSLIAENECLRKQLALLQNQLSTEK